MEAHDRAALRPIRHRAHHRDIGDHHEAFVAAPRRADLEVVERIDEAVDLLLRRFEFEREQPAGALEIALPDVVAGMFWPRRPQHVGNFGTLRRPLADLHRRRFVRGETDGHRADAAQGQISVVAADADAKGAMIVVHRCPGFLGRCDGAEQHVGVADDVLGAGQHRDVGAVFQRLIEVARAPGVIDAENNAARFGQSRQRRQIEHFEGAGAGDFGVNEFGVGFEPAFDIAAVGFIDFASDTPGFEHGLGKIAGRLVGGFGDQAMIAGLQKRHHPHAVGDQARPGDARAIAAFQVGDHVLEREDGRRAIGSV